MLDAAKIARCYAAARKDASAYVTRYQRASDEIIIDIDISIDMHERYAMLRGDVTRVDAPRVDAMLRLLAYGC